MFRKPCSRWSLKAEGGRLKKGDGPSRLREVKINSSGVKIYATN